MQIISSGFIIIQSYTSSDYGVSIPIRRANYYILPPFQNKSYVL